MPCNGETDNYHSFVECTEQLQELTYTYQGTHDIIIGGDFNENALVKNSLKRSICFHIFLNENDIVTRYTDHTLIHPNGKDTSTIDFFLYKQRTKENIISINRLEKYMENVSDHYPISLTMKLKLEKNYNKNYLKIC